MYGSRPASSVHDASPYFFLSYAATPAPGEQAAPGRPLPDKNVGEFYADLSAEVARMSGASARTPVGYVEQPGHSAERTARALLGCGSFIPLVSRRYFTDASCGRQWHAFTHRFPPGALLPVLWTPVPITARPVIVDLELPVPEAPATAVPVDTKALEFYAENGLYGLRQDTDRSWAYAQCVRRIAQCVVQAAAREIPETSPTATEPAALGDLPDAFAASPWHPLGIAVFAPDLDHLPPDRADTKYGPGPRDWQPFSDNFGASLAERTAGLARNLGFAPDVRTFDQAEPVFLGLEEVTSPWVLILDPWILYDPAAVERLRAFDARDLPWVTVLTPLADDPQTDLRRRELGDLLGSALPRRLAGGRFIQRMAAAGIENSEAFNSRFMELADSAAQHYLNRAPIAFSTRSSRSSASAAERRHTGPDGTVTSVPDPAEPRGDQEDRP
ncbi:FxsC protein [Streptomyces polygonati]|uniref:FxsC protein n=1 Tax=Streptomyces polygonati TaxID=1617087 RepID=A0ABV8HUP9_9ACTN